MPSRRGRLKDVIKTSVSNWLSFLQTTDIYDPDRVEADRDLLRRFYLKHGYADVRIVSAIGEYDPAKKGFIVTFTIDEGSQYHVGTVDVVSNVHAIDPASLRGSLKLSRGSVYNADLVEKSVEAMTIEAAKRGYAFANVRPRGDRDFQTKIINLAFVVEEGTRAYIERINIRGNTRTRDYVIRREFDIGEGDAYNRALIDRAERRLKNLDFFKTVKITNEPGSAPDRVVINVNVEETVDRRVLDLRRLLDRRRLPRRGQRRRPQPDGPRPVRQGVGELRPIYARLRPVVSSSPICSATAWPAASTCSARQKLATSYVSYNTQTIGTNLRLGFALTEELSLQPHYSIYQQEITLPDYLNNCMSPTGDVVRHVRLRRPDTTRTTFPVVWRPCSTSATPTAKPRCRCASSWPTARCSTSLVGYTLAYNTLDNNKSPTSGLFAELKQDFAGVGGDVNFIRTTAETRNYYEVLPGHRRRAASAGRHI